MDLNNIVSLQGMRKKRHAGVVEQVVVFRVVGSDDAIHVELGRRSGGVTWRYVVKYNGEQVAAGIRRCEHGCEVAATIARQVAILKRAERANSEV